MCYSQSVNVPLDHWAYSFLDRMEVRGCFRSLLLRTRPISRVDLAKIISEIEISSSKGKVTLSKAERSVLEQLKGEFFEELNGLSENIQKRYHEKHLFAWEENNNQFKIDVDFSQRFDINRGSNYDTTGRTSLTTLGGIVRGQLKNKIAFFLHFKNTLIRGQDIDEENFNPGLGMPITISGENVYQDEASAYFVWKLPWGQIELGRDQAQWGPCYKGSLMLSAQNPLFDLFKINAQFKRFQFTSIHGKLNSSAGQKYLAAHRIEFQPFPWLFLAGSEAVVYGNRDMELQYLNPLMPYHIAEHHLGDHDNNMMSFDVTLFPKAGHKVYAELFLDDMTTAENPFTYYGNKFAFTVGHYWANPFRMSNLDVKIEYTRLEPFVYTHQDSVNVYEHYNRHIGHWLEPNSDQLYFETAYLLNRDIKMSFIAERIRHGDGDIHSPYQEEMGTKKSFLSGIVETKWRIGFSITDQIFRDVFLNLQYHYINTGNLNHISGNDSKDNQIIFQLNANL